MVWRATLQMQRHRHGNRIWTYIDRHIQTPTVRADIDRHRPSLTVTDGCSEHNCLCMICRVWRVWCFLGVIISYHMSPHYFEEHIALWEWYFVWRLATHRIQELNLLEWIRFFSLCVNYVGAGTTWYICVWWGDHVRTSRLCCRDGQENTGLTQLHNHEMC